MSLLEQINSQQEQLSFDELLIKGFEPGLIVDEEMMGDIKGKFSLWF
jgi:hypothetical protein